MITMGRKKYRESKDYAGLQLKHCVSALGLIFVAAARPGGDTIRYRLPAVIPN